MARAATNTCFRAPTPFDVYRDTAGQCVSCTPYSCHRDNFAGDSRLTGPEDRTMSDSYEFATHRFTYRSTRGWGCNSPGLLTGYVAGSRTRQRAQSKLIFQDDVSSPCIRIEHDNDLATVQLTPDGALLVIQCPLFSTVVCSVTGYKLLEQSVESLATQCLNRDLHNPHSARSSPPFQGMTPSRNRRECDPSSVLRLIRSHRVRIATRRPS